MSGLRLDADEQAAMDELLSAFARIQSWGLSANRTELVSAVHVIQGFIVQHMLSRLNPADWGDWYVAGSTDSDPRS